MAKLDFFVSYTQSDEEWAMWLAWVLTQEGYTTRLQAQDFVPGSHFVYEINRAGMESEQTIAVLSPDYLARGFPLAEWAMAFSQDPAGEKRKLVPVRVSDFKPDGLLAQIVYIDLVGLNEGSARERLVAGIGRTRQVLGDERPPRFPGSTEAYASAPRFPAANAATPAVTSRDLHHQSQTSKRSSLRRFFHSKVSGSGLLDMDLRYNPYQEHVDPTDSMLPESNDQISAYFWFPREEVLASSRLEPFTSVSAICTPRPLEAIESLRGLLATEDFSALALPPRKLRREEKEHLFSAMALALDRCFVAVITIPEIVLGSGRSKPELAYQVMLDLFFCPLVSLHERLGVQRLEATISRVGERDRLVLRVAKKNARACFPRKGRAFVELVGLDDSTSETFVRIARLFAWAVGHYYNYGDRKWLDLIEKTLD